MDKSQNDLTEISIEELMKIEVETVYAASKRIQTVLDAPSAITVINASDIREYGYRTLADILKNVRGFYITYDRNYNYIGVRGFNRPGDYNSRILLLVNGNRMNDNIYNSASIGTEFVLDVDIIDKIEVIRGPGSSLFGTNAFFGIINVVTKNGKDFRGIQVSGETASFDTYKGRITYGNHFQNGFEMLLSSTTYSSKGQSLYFKEFDNPAQNNGYADSCDYDKYKSFFSKFSFNGLSLEGAYSTRNKGIPTGAWGIVFNDSTNATTDESGYLHLKFVKTFFNSLDTEARVFYGRYKYYGNYIYPPLNDDSALGEWLGGEIKFSKTLFNKHKLTFGAEYQDNFKQQQENKNINPYSLNLNDNRSSMSWGVYLQDEFTIQNNLILNVGSRYDYYQTFGDTFNPRIGLIYNPIDNAVIKLLYGEAYRAPSAYEMYYHDSGATQLANRNLKPENIKTYEIVYEQYFGNTMRLSASGFYYRIDDLISLQNDNSTGLLIFQNIDKVESKGIELELSRKWKNGFKGSISCTFQETKNLETKRPLTNSPKNLGKLNVLVPLLSNDITAGIELQYTGNRLTLLNKTVGGFILGNLTIASKNVIKGLEISASIYNMFDKTYSDPAGPEHVSQGMDRIIQDGRSFRLKMIYTF